jgi:c-di-GMP phosphodiesterase
VFEFPPATREASPEPIDLGVVTPGWQPLIARDLRPVGFRLVLRADDRGDPPASIAALLDGVLSGFVAEGATSLPHGLVVLAPFKVVFDDSLIGWRAPRNVLLEIGQEELDDAETMTRLLEAQRRGVRLALRVTDHTRVARERVPLFHYVVVDAEAHVPGPAGAALFALAPRSNAAVNDAFKGGAHAVVGWPLDEIASGATGQLQPVQQAVLDLIRLVQADAQNGDLEKAFKREPVLSYMLLTLANSPAFIRRAPIASIAHAIQLLGYQRLVKWLVLLMVVASKESKALPQIYTAVARGFLMENLAAVAGIKGRQRDECFIIGAFSLLDKITGRDPAQLLADVPLPDAVSAALARRTGTYAPFLEITLALERGNADAVHAGVAALQLSQGAVNQALLQALAAADGLQSVV